MAALLRASERAETTAEGSDAMHDTHWRSFRNEVGLPINDCEYDALPSRAARKAAARASNGNPIFGASLDFSEYHDLLPATPFYGRFEWKRTRRQVRLAAGFKCSMCGELSPQGLHVHHRKPLNARLLWRLRTVEPDTLCTAVPQHAEEPRNGTPQRGCDIDGNPLSEMHPWNVGGDGRDIIALSRVQRIGGNGGHTICLSVFLIMVGQTWRA